jgi:hypothetical protein
VQPPGPSLGEGPWVALIAEDERALNPLFWSNVAPYGEVKIDMPRRITLYLGYPPYCRRQRR